MAVTTREQSEELVRRMIEEVWSRGDLDVLDEIAAEDYEEYDPVLPEIVEGRDAFKETVAMFRGPIPDLEKHIEAVFIDDDTVVVHYRATGTHEGELMGIPPTGTEAEVQGVFIYTVEDGQLVRGIDMWDAFGLLQQLGALQDSDDE